MKMTSSSLCFGLICSLLMLGCDRPRPRPGHPLLGYWAGTMQANGIELRTGFQITQDSSGTLHGTLDSLDQGAHHVPLSSALLEEPNVTFHCADIQGTFEGKIDEDGASIVGQWAQGGVSLPLTLKRMESREAFLAQAAQETFSPVELSQNLAAAARLPGTWEGALAVGSTNLRLQLRFTRNAAGNCAGTLDSPDQGAKAIPLSKILCRVNELEFQAKGIAASFQGSFSQDLGKISGHWLQHGRSLPITFTRTAD